MAREMNEIERRLFNEFIVIGNMKEKLETDTIDDKRKKCGFMVQQIKDFSLINGDNIYYTIEEKEDDCFSEYEMIIIPQYGVCKYYLDFALQIKYKETVYFFDIEIDSFAWHDTNPSSFADERDRANILVSCGFIPMRIVSIWVNNNSNDTAWNIISQCIRYIHNSQNMQMNKRFNFFNKENGNE